MNTSDRDSQIVGPEWNPLIFAMIALTNGLRAGNFWRMDSHSGAHGYDPYTSPYAQVLLETDGTLRAEVRGHTMIGDRRAELALLGWDVPDSAPNAYRAYATGWNTVSVATEIIGALTLLFDFQPSDLVTFGSKSDDVRALGVMSEMHDGIFRIEEPDPIGPEPGLPLSDSDGFDTAVEITARLVEAGLIHSPGQPTSIDVAGPSRRQGVSYQHSGFSDNDIVAWTIDVTSWPDPADVDWVDHLEELEVRFPLALITGTNWALTVREGQLDSDVPERLAQDIRTLLPGSYIQWGRGYGATWFEPRFRRASEVLAALRDSGFEVEVEGAGPDAQLGDYLTESLDDDSFASFRVGLDGGPAGFACVLIDENVAEGAAVALDGYLNSTAISSTIAGDGWVIRVTATESFDVDADEYAQQMADALGASYASSTFVDVKREVAPVDTTLWGPQSTEMKAMLLWASRYIFAVPQERWDDARRAAWDRVLVAAGEANRIEGINQAEALMRAISTNDFFHHTGVEALHALAVRDVILPDDYDTFTVPWRRQVGRIHSDDAEVEWRPGSRPIDKHALPTDDFE